MRSIREVELLQAIKENLADIDALAAQLDDLEERGVYKYYSQSFKAFDLQNAIEQGQELFARLAPPHRSRRTNRSIRSPAALEHKFSLLDRTVDWDRMNEEWQTWTRPILEAFWHCSFFVRMLARYGRELDEPPLPWGPSAWQASPTPAGWLAVLALYGLG